jgi:PEP-CTERM motif
MSRVGLLTVLVALALTAAFPLGANAGTITTFTSLGAFPGNDSLDWGQLGPEFTVVAAPFSATSVGGLTIHVTQPGNGSFERRDGMTSFSGSFPSGDHLIWNQDNSGEMDFSQTPIAGFGTSISTDAGGTFTATLKAFDGATLLGSLTVSGDAIAGGPLPPFAGITDSVAEITSIVITANASAPVGTNNGFLIDSLSLLTAPVPVPVPEPATWLLLSSALLGFAVVRRRNRNV